MRGRHEFAQVLTARTDLSVKFDERWQVSRIAVAILFPVLASTAIGVSYSIAANGPPTAFTIAGTFVPWCTWTVVAEARLALVKLGYVTSAYSVCLVLFVLLDFVDSSFCTPFFA